MEKNDDLPINYMQNRELSWLRFNERVLQEAQDPEVPLFERLKFFSIYSNNLDEFFMIRVGSLYDLTAEKGSEVTDNKTGMSAREQLRAVYEAVRPLYLQRDATYAELRKLMNQEGIHHLAFSELTDMEQVYITEYFSRYILPVLSPQIVDNHHPFPFIPNKKLFVALQLESKDKDSFGLIPVPSEVPELIFLPGDDIRFIPSAKVIYEYAKNVFDLYNVRDKVIFCVTRNADISVEDQDIDMTEDFRSVMKKLLRKRRSLEIVRLELGKKINGWLKDSLCDKLKVDPQIILISRAPILMNYESPIAAVMDENRKRNYYYKPFQPKLSSEVSSRESMINQISKKDVLLSYPYESMEPFLRMIKEASEDSTVVSIKITIYRLAQRAKLVEYLCAAAENGKEVVVLIELRARFDEQNNIDWSVRLEEAGCRLIYGIGDYKVHSKICLITRKTHGDYLFITQVGTGNYNEKTTELYTDFALITANQEIGRDASNFFKNMTISNLSGDYRHLMVAPNSMKNRIIELIAEEMDKGEDGRISFKINSLTDYDIMQKLREASCAGVKVDLIVRGICCLLPGVPGETENIRVTSLVGRFLEHTRFYRFGVGADQKLFISSADFMTRNMDRRVEVACPIFSETVKDRLNTIFDSMLYDTEKARVMQPDGTYRKKPANLNRINIQELFIEEAKRKARISEPERSLKAFFRNLRKRASLYLFQ